RSSTGVSASATATAAPTERWKGFALPALEKAFGVTQGFAGYRVPYFDAEGTLHRVKLFPDDDSPVHWLGPSKPQIPYGLWRMPKEGKVLVLTEGESDLFAVSAYLPKIPVIGIPGAASWKPDWAAYLAPFERVFIVGDGDRAGREFADRVVADRPDGRLVLMPEGADTRALLQTLGSRAFVALLTAAEGTYRMRRAMAQAIPSLTETKAVAAAWTERD